MNISAVERETGLSKDVLRVWERRYGFPAPSRDANDERQYSAADVAKLRAIKRLMDSGSRPGKLIRKSLAELDALAETALSSQAPPARASSDGALLELLREHDAAQLQQALAATILKRGVQRFALEVAAPWSRALGENWLRGGMAIFEQHFYTEQMHRALRGALATLARTRGRRMILATLPGELHGLGLLLLEAIAAPEGVECISLGTQTPVDEVARAADAFGADFVTLSFSPSFPTRHAFDALTVLRARLPTTASLWARGEALRRLRKPVNGVELVPDLDLFLSKVRTAVARSDKRA